MNKILNLLKWGATLGKEPQNFLGASWIQSFLKRVPSSKKRIWALRILSLSPHYFINPDQPEFKGLSNDEYLEKAFQIATDSRRKINDHILNPYLKPDDAVLDYGCGPGFLAKAVSTHVRSVHALDISSGVLACSQILNAAPNIEYITAAENGLKTIADESIDVIYSFAVAQHLTDEILDSVLENCRKKLKPNGLLFLHIQLQQQGWRTEDDWKSDQSVQGKIKYRYGLHCFWRTEEKYLEMVANHGFGDAKIKPVKNLIVEDFDDIYHQHLLTARKK